LRYELEQQSTLITMSNKVQLSEELSELGYKLGPFASKETLTNVLRLHSTVNN